MNGKLIVITGLDGSGKTTQTELLIDNLRKNGHEVEHVDFPQYGKTFFADLIARYLNGEFSSSDPQAQTGKSQSVNPYFTSLLYAGDRWEIKESIQKWLAGGKIVISNRYTCCNKAYQGAKIDNKEERDKFFDWLDKLEHQVYQIPRPDLTIFLSNEVEIALDLISKRKPREYCLPDESTENESLKTGNALKDIHEEDADFLKNVQKTYLELVDNESSWELIESVNNGALLTKSEIAEKIWNIVSKTISE